MVHLEPVMLPELEKVEPGWTLDAPGSPWPELRAEMARKVPDAGRVAGLGRSFGRDGRKLDRPAPDRGRPEVA